MYIVLVKPSYGITAELEDKVDNLLEDGLHLLMAAFPNGRQRHQPSMAILPVGWRQMHDSLHGDASTHFKKQFLDSRLCSICMMCCLIMGKMIFPPRPQAILSRALSPATALLDKQYK